MIYDNTLEKKIIHFCEMTYYWRRCW